MQNALVSKFAHFRKWTAGESEALNGLVSRRLRRIGPHEDIVREGEPPRVMRALLSGWACRYKQLPNGRRQIVGLFLPGDICECNVSVLRMMDHSLGTISPVTVAEITPEEFAGVTREYPALAEAFYWDALVNNSIQREWTLSLGARSALERTAHILCELFERLRIVGMTEDHSFELPMTQPLLAEAMGISAVHMNRVLQELRASGLILLRGKDVSILDFPRLQLLAGFTRDYLHGEIEGDSAEKSGF